MSALETLSYNEFAIEIFMNSKLFRLVAIACGQVVEFQKITFSASFEYISSKRSAGPAAVFLVFTRI
jgi:hypothetical protein